MLVATKNIDCQVVIEGKVVSVLKDYPNCKAIAVKANGIPDHVKAENYPNTFIAKGRFLRAYTGQCFSMTGTWVEAKNGWYLKVSSYYEVMPKDRNSVIEYLCSNIFKGLGRRNAEAIVDTFGEATIEVVRSFPERLLNVRGLAIRKAYNIIEAVKESNFIEKLMFSLSPHGISQKAILKVYEEYGTEALNMIIANPYRMCEEIPNVDFDMCDSIAKECNFLPNNSGRLRAAMIHVLHYSANAQGHSYLPYEVLLKEVKMFLEMKSNMSGRVDMNDIAMAVVLAANMGDIIIERDNSIYLPEYYSAEQYVARKLELLMHTRGKKFRYDTESIIEKLECQYRIKYSSAQKDALRQAFNKIMVISGGAGSGKSTIIRSIVKLYEMNFPSCKVVLCAPTGRAAERMTEATGYEAMTIHRLLENRPSMEGASEFGKNEMFPIQADAIIVDEMSMCNLILLSQLLKAVKPDTSIIFVGDVDQLPSVGAGNVLRDMIQSLMIPTVHLNEIFRQADTSRIVVNGDLIKRGNCDLEFGSDFLFIEEEDENKIPSIISDYFCKELADIKDISNVLVISPLRDKTVTSARNLNKLLQDKLNPLSTYTKEMRSTRGHTNIRTNDKVLNVKNNYDKKTFNGSMGYVKRIDLDRSKVVIDFSGRDVEYFKDELDELQPAYAITIHKSQGSEQSTVLIPLAMSHKKLLQRHLLYTAATRARHKVILVGQLKALNFCINNTQADKRYSKLKERLVEKFEN